MANPAALQDELTSIEAILTQGVASIRASDGKTVEYDLPALERRAAAIRRQLAATSSGASIRRVVMKRG